MNNKITYLCLSTLITFNMILRYPVFPYEQGTDSFGNHVISNFIVDNGYNSQYLSFLSYFGAYPFSNNMGGAFLLSAFNLVTGLSNHINILILGFIFAVISVFIMFMLVEKITKNKEVALVSSLLFTTSRAFITYTSWTYSYRALVIFFMPFLFYFLFRIIENGRLLSKYSFLLCFIFLSALASHHASVFFFLAIISYLLHLIIAYIVPKEKSLLLLSHDKSFLFSSIFLVILYVSAIHFGSVYEGSIPRSIDLGRSLFFDNDSILFTLLNFGLMYSMIFGFTLVLIIYGLYSISSKFRINKHNNYMFIYILLCFYSIIWLDRFYGYILIMPIISTLVGLGIVNLCKKIKIRDQVLPFPIILSVILLVQYIPEAIVVVESGNSPSDDQQYSRNREIELASSTGFYLKSNEMDYSIFSEGVSAPKISSFSGYFINIYSPPMDFEYIGYEYAELDRLMSGEVDSLVVDNNEYTGYNLRYQVVLSDRTLTDEYVKLAFLSQYHSDKIICALYASYPVLTQNDDGEIIVSGFLVSVVDSTYNFYNNGYHALYFLNLSDNNL